MRVYARRALNDAVCMRGFMLGCAGLLSACGPAVYYDAVSYDELSVEERPSAEVEDELRDPQADWVDAPSDAIPRMERVRYARNLEAHPSAKQACLQRLKRARAQVFTAIETAKALSDTERLSCLSRHARSLQAIHGMLVFGSNEIDDRSLCEEVPRVIDDARSCR